MKLFFTIGLMILSFGLFGQRVQSNDTTSTLKPEIRGNILKESKDGGKLDFWTPIKGHEYDGELLQSGPTTKDNIYASKKEIAVVKWAFSLTKLGVKKNDLISLYEELKGRKLRSDDITLIDIGIKKASR
jgi:hypothetical protein